MDGFYHDEGEPLRRPERVRRLTFEDAWRVGGENAAAAGVVPLELLEDGDRQAGVFVERPAAPGRHDWGPPTSLDALAGRPDVDSVVGIGPVVARVPLPGVRELVAGLADDETLRNLPNLEWLSVHEAVGGGALDPGAIPASVRWLLCGVGTFGSPEAVADRLPDLERLRMRGFWNGRSIEPLAPLSGLRWLHVDPGKGLQHLGKLEALERLELDLVDGPKLTGLTRLRKLTRLRSLRLVGSGVRGLDGLGDLAALEELDLERAAVAELAPLAGHPALASVRIEHPRGLTDLTPLGALPTLRRLVVRFGGVGPRVEVPSLEWLRAAGALEELELSGVDASGADPAPLYGLERLRAVKLVGRFAAGERELREGLRAQDVELFCDGEPPARTAVGPVSYVRLDDGTWSIFEDATLPLGVDTNYEAEERVRGAIRDEDGELHDRLTFDSEAGALSITAQSENDIRRAAEMVAAMTTRS